MIRKNRDKEELTMNIWELEKSNGFLIRKMKDIGEMTSKNIPKPRFLDSSDEQNNSYLYSPRLSFCNYSLLKKSTPHPHQRDG